MSKKIPGSIYELLWNSKSSTTPVLKWGTQSKNYQHNYPAFTLDISDDNFKNKLADGSSAKGIGWRKSGLMHVAWIDLTEIPNVYDITKIYQYVFGDDSTSTFSEEKVFYIPQLPGQQHKKSNVGNKVTTLGELCM